MYLTANRASVWANHTVGGLLNEEIQFADGDAPQVVFAVRLVLDEPEEVEAGEERRGQLDVLLDAALRVVAAVGGVSGGEDGDARVQTRHDARLEEARRINVQRTHHTDWCTGLTNDPRCRVSQRTMYTAVDESGATDV